MRSITDKGCRSIAACVCFKLDSAFYGVATFTPLTFLRQNVLNSISLFYGTNSTHFYFSQAIPFLLMTQLPFAWHGLWIIGGNKAMTVLKWVMGTTIAMYSLLGHKEFRFLHPLLPILHLFVAQSLVELYLTHMASQESSTGHLLRLSNILKIRRSHIIFLAISLLPAIYLTSFHSLGQVQVMEYLRNAIARDDVQSVAFLMPCHSTPWQSHLHRSELETSMGSGEGGRAWFIGCEPPVLYVSFQLHITFD